MAKLEDLQNNVRQFELRTCNLRDRARRGSPDSSLLEEAVQELSISTEELKVALEEIESQNRELVAANAEALRQQERYRELFLSAHEGYVVTDLKGVVREANRAACRLLDRSLELLVHKPLALMIDLGDRHEIYELLNRARRGEPCKAELSIASPNGSQLCMLRVSPLVNRGGVRISELRWSIRDLTEREQARRAERLEAESKQKDHFLAMLGHELRNPLAPILSVATMLTEGDGLMEDRRRWAHQVLLRQTQQLQHLVGDLLDVSRLSRGKLTLRLEQVDLVKLIGEQLEALAPQAAAKEQTLEAELPDQPVVVRGDRTRLRQIVSNLVDNAIKYTPHGGHIQIELSGQGDAARLRVRDTGVGIEAEHLPTVFEMFKQWRRSGDIDGLGLGLPLVKHLAELHGGQVEARSEGPGRGTEIELSLPLADRPEASDDTPAEPVPVGASRRILVVDDNVDAAELLAIALQTEGHSVVIAHDAIRALEQARAQQPELVLLDLGLPGINGFELAPKLASELPDVRLVAITGYGDRDSRVRSSEAGFAEHLVKPVDLAQLRALMAALS